MGCRSTLVVFFFFVLFPPLPPRGRIAICKIQVLLDKLNRTCSWVLFLFLSQNFSPPPSTVGKELPERLALGCGGGCSSFSTVSSFSSNEQGDIELKFSSGGELTTPSSLGLPPKGV